jgi:hypothetical protein
MCCSPRCGDCGIHGSAGSWRVRVFSYLPLRSVLTQALRQSRNAAVGPQARRGCCTCRLLLYMTTAHSVTASIATPRASQSHSREEGPMFPPLSQLKMRHIAEKSHHNIHDATVICDGTAKQLQSIETDTARPCNAEEAVPASTDVTDTEWMPEKVLRT